jgi:hypothetical protein
MQTMQFLTTITKPYIEIPDFDKLKGKQIKVVLLNSDNDKNTTDDFISSIIKKPRHINPNDNFLSRYDANER